MARKKTDVAPGGALMPFDSWTPLAELEGVFDRSLVAGAKSSSGGIAPMISTEDGVMRDGANEIGDTLDAVILGVVVEHQLYPGRYVKGKRSSPVCFYVGPDEENAAPHETSPEKQATSCGTCIKNTFGSAGGGSNAKACRQGRRLLILPLGENDDPASAQLRRLRVPPTSIKYISAYVKEVEARGFEVSSVVTRISVAGHEKNRFEMQFSPLRPLRSREQLLAAARQAAKGKDELFALPLLGSDNAGGLAGTARKGATPGRRQVVQR